MDICAKVTRDCLPSLAPAGGRDEILTLGRHTGPSNAVVTDGAHTQPPDDAVASAAGACHHHRMHDAASSRTISRHPDVSTFRPRAMVFDLDGTLTDNMALHAEAFAVFAARHGLPPLTIADRKRFDGKRNSEIFPALFGRALDAGEVLELEVEKESLYRERSAGLLSPAPGAAELIDRARARGIAVAIATSAPADNVTHTLREIGMPWLLDVVARGDMVPRGKPFPDVFLEAARRVGVEPSACLAFEDAPMGVEAAVAAGMACVAVTTSFDAATFMSASVPPHACVAHYEEFLDGPGAWLRQ